MESLSKKVEIINFVDTMPTFDGTEIIPPIVENKKQFVFIFNDVFDDGLAIDSR